MLSDSGPAWPSSPKRSTEPSRHGRNVHLRSSVRDRRQESFASGGPGGDGKAEGASGDQRHLGGSLRNEIQRDLHGGRHLFQDRERPSSTGRASPCSKAWPTSRTAARRHGSKSPATPIRSAAKKPIGCCRSNGLAPFSAFSRSMAWRPRGSRRRATAIPGRSRRTTPSQARKKPAHRVQGCGPLRR
jgi:hypothetical protein